jgi:hypothetical protein
LYSSSNIVRANKSRRMRWSGHAACMENIQNAYNILVENPGMKRPFGRCRHRWQKNIKMDLGETVYESVNWIHVAQNMD